MIGFDNAKIDPVYVRALIHYETQCFSQEQIDAAKQDFESAIELLKGEAAVRVQWLKADGSCQEKGE